MRDYEIFSDVEFRVIPLCVNALNTKACYELCGAVFAGGMESTSTLCIRTNRTFLFHMVVNGQEYVLVTDYLGSVRFVVNANSGVVEQKLDYDACELIQQGKPGFM